MVKHHVVVEVGTDKTPVGQWLVIAVPDDYNLHDGFPHASLVNPVAAFPDQQQANGERDRLNGQLKIPGYRAAVIPWSDSGYTPKQAN